MKNKEIRGTTKKVYDYIAEFSEENGYPPSVREIARDVGIKSTSTVFYHLEKLEKAELLKRSGTKNQNRAISLSSRRSSHAVRSLPLVGKVAAGLPITAIENITDTLELPDSIFSGDSLFLLRVQGDSMKNAGILNGDLIAVNKQEDARNGDIVVAMLDGEATVKRFYHEENAIRLQPENESYEPIISKDIKVIGKVVGLIRSSI